MIFKIYCYFSFSSKFIYQSF